MFGKKKTYHGCDHDKLEQILYTLCALEDDLDLTDTERFSMDIAIHAVSSIMNAMSRNGKVVFDG